MNVVVCILGALAVSICAALPAAAQEKSTPTTVYVSQAYQSLIYLPLYVALDEGLFAKRGLDVQKITAGSGANAIASVISKSSTFSLQDPMTAVLANLKGAKLKNVAAIADGIPNWIAAGKDSPIKTLADLEGKTIAAATPPSTGTYLLERLLKQRGIHATVQYVLLGTEQSALTAGKVDAATMSEPFIDIALSLGAHIIYEYAHTMRGGYAYSTITASEETIAQNPRMVSAFVAGLDEAEGLIGSNPERASDIAVSEFKGMQPAIVRAAFTRMNAAHIYAKHAAIEQSAFENAIGLQYDIGNLKPGTVKYTEAVDPLFGVAALKKER